MQSGTEGPTSAPLVLICDDVEPIRRLLRINLELAGFEVDEATDGHEAMARLIDVVRRRPDVVVLDSQMAPYDGWWAIAAIRSHPRLDPVPVLLVTAAASDHARYEVDEAGFDGIVTKPFDPDELVAAVSRLAASGRAARGRP
ncbi:response regulator [Oryzobacter sp. R7]|uniref:response regulator n=1 Tax=Oryzobacter faecalis TaxID=3388656 RepID=UPI00398C91C1